MLNEKTALRREIISLRRAVSPSVLDIEALRCYPSFNEAKVVFCYVSSKGEVKTHSLIEELLKEKTVVVPYCTDKEGSMIAVKINSLDELKEGSFGILEPINPIEFPKGKIDFVIVPGLAFDKEGYRLGYGKGYYDRFLSDISPFKLGVCEERFFYESIAHNEFDIKMDNIKRM